MRFHPYLARVAAILCALGALAGPLPAFPAFDNHAVRLTVDGPIGPATSDYFSRSLDKAVDEGASIVILQMDTPGGLDASMRDIIRNILSSPIPVVGYVAPNGARAASAGTYIMYASHIAAMAPATNLGAATPVQLGGGGPEIPGREPEKGDDQEQGEQPSGGTEPEPRPLGEDAMAHKVVNDAVAYIRGLAKLRGRNAEWAEQAVRRAASLDAGEALEKNVIDLIAVDVDELLAKIDGRTVEVHGSKQTLATADIPVTTMEPDWRSELLAVITNPNVAYILMLVGIYGLIFEFANPGTIVPGVIGGICLLLALFALQVLPINYAGLGLILLGVALMTGEAFVPSFGILGIGGVVAFVIGSIILIDTDAPGFGISVALIGAVALFSAILFATVMGLILRARRRPVVSGREEMLGTRAIALEDFDREGQVRAHGERWLALTDAPVTRGQALQIVGMEGLHLRVRAEQEAHSGQPKGV